MHPYVGRWSWLDAGGDTSAKRECVFTYFVFVGAEFHAVNNSSFLRSFSELLEFFFTASQLNVVSIPHVAKWSSTDGHRQQWDVSFPCIFYCITCKVAILRWMLNCQSFLHYLFQQIINSTGDNGNAGDFSPTTRMSIISSII